MCCIWMQELGVLRGAAASHKQGLTYAEFTRRPKFLQKWQFTKFIV